MLSRFSRVRLCDPIDGSPRGSPVPGILQARTLEWVAISFSNARKWKVKVKSLSYVRLLATPWIAAYQAPPSMGYSRQEYWSRVPLPSPPTLLFFNSGLYIMYNITYIYIYVHKHICTGRPGVLQSMGSQRVRPDWVTEQEHICIYIYSIFLLNYF